MKLIVGLGNPGGKYAHNRHNIGFMALDEIHRRNSGFQPWRARFQGQVSEGRLGSEKVLLLKPSTYMNESGRAIGEAARDVQTRLDETRNRLLEQEVEVLRRAAAYLSQVA